MERDAPAGPLGSAEGRARLATLVAAAVAKAAASSGEAAVCTRESPSASESFLEHKPHPRMFNAHEFIFFWRGGGGRGTKVEKWGLRGSRQAIQPQLWHQGR